MTTKTSPVLEDIIKEQEIVELVDRYYLRFLQFPDIRFSTSKQIVTRLGKKAIAFSNQLDVEMCNVTTPLVRT